jgi:hypothetical protein
MTAYYTTPHILIVTYNLKGAATAYTQFYETLKVQGRWWHYLPSTWLIHTTRTPEEVADAVRVHMIQGDHIFVGTLQNGYNGYLPKDAWEWIQGHGLSSNP